MKYTVLVLMLVTTRSAPIQYECIRWTWTGDVYNRKVVCLEWREKNASSNKEKKI